MNRTIINRLIILGFMGSIGFCLARAIYFKSVLGIILALVSLAASVWFLYILAKAKEEMLARQSESDN